MKFEWRNFNRKVTLNRYQIVCGLFMLLGVAFVGFIGFHRESTIVTYNVNHTLTLFSQAAAKKSLTPAQLKVLTHSFSQTLSHTVNEYAVSHHVIIVKSAAIIAGCDDITPAIEQQLSQHMKKKS